jgi:hypothetical protein
MNDIHNYFLKYCNETEKYTIKDFEEIFINEYGINQTFMNIPFNYRRPLKVIRNDKGYKNEDEEYLILYSKARYNIIFINYGIRICMTKDFLQKIIPLNSIMIKKNGNDCNKLFQLKYYSENLNKYMESSYIYISELPIESLLIEKKPEDIKIKNKDNEEYLDKWFEDDNIISMITKELWYSR